MISLTLTIIGIILGALALMAVVDCLLSHIAQYIRLKGTRVTDFSHYCLVKAKDPKYSELTFQFLCRYHHEDYYGTILGPVGTFPDALWCETYNQHTGHYECDLKILQHRVDGHWYITNAHGSTHPDTARKGKLYITSCTERTEAC